jgi:hypothetical protein
MRGDAHKFVTLIGVALHIEGKGSKLQRIRVDGKLTLMRRRILAKTTRKAYAFWGIASLT